MTKPALIASLLDPRHKDNFLAPNERDAARTTLREICATAEAANPDGEEAPGAAAGASGGEETSGEEDEMARAVRRSAMTLLLGDEYSAPLVNDPEKEVDTYMGDNPLSLDSCPLDWYAANQVRFPRLAILARRYLCIPGTSVPSERVFSAAGLTVNRLRTRLTPEHVDMLLFMNKNR